MKTIRTEDPQSSAHASLGGYVLPKYARATQDRTTTSKKLLLHRSHWRRDCVTLFPNALVQHNVAYHYSIFTSKDKNISLAVYLDFKKLVI